MQQAFRLYLRLFLTILLTFWLHRGLSFAGLVRGSGSEATTIGLAQAIIVGALSDLWIAYLTSLVVMPLLLLLHNNPRTQQAIAWCWALLIIAIVGAHQAYVDFFHFPIVSSHLSYLLDVDFMRANAASVLAVRTLIVAGVGALIFCGLSFARVFRGWNRVACAIAIVILSVAGLFCHNRNIHYRVQWFVPESLQTNAFEQLYLSYKVARTPNALSKDELALLERGIGASSVENDASTETRLANLVTRPIPNDDAMSPLGVALKNVWQEAVESQKRPIMQVILMESLRPAETSLFYGKDSTDPDLTPTLKSLANDGISFRRAYSYGTVTRGAQEAVLCGYLGSQDTSMMRGRPEIHAMCLPDLLHDGSHAGDLFWFHGGEGRFDGQLNFWQQHHIDHSLTIEDFPSEAPRSGWGIADGVFFGTAAEKLTALHAASRKPFLMGMLLSVSNHIPWDLPQDAPAAVRDLKVFHPSYRTTAYSDWALGEYVNALKKNGLWEQSLIVIASDHGTTIPPLAKSDAATTEPELKTHINLLVVGGLVEKALANIQQKNIVEERPTAQSDVASFMAYVLGIEDVRFMGESLFIAKRQLPIAVDLGRSYYLPEQQRELTLNEALLMPAEKLDEPLRLGVLYNRAFLALLNEWSRSMSQRRGS